MQFQFLPIDIHSYKYYLILTQSYVSSKQGDEKVIYFPNNYLILNLGDLWVGQIFEIILTWLHNHWED